MDYWVNLIEDVPYFFAHVHIKTKDAVDGKKVQMRVCFEFAKEEDKYLWREQIMFHADLVPFKKKKTEFSIDFGKQKVYNKDV